jgi:hypothetical protein
MRHFSAETAMSTLILLFRTDFKFVVQYLVLQEKCSARHEARKDHINELQHPKLGLLIHPNFESCRSHSRYVKGPSIAHIFPNIRLAGTFPDRTRVDMVHARHPNKGHIPRMVLRCSVQESFARNRLTEIKYAVVRSSLAKSARECRHSAKARDQNRRNSWEYARSGPDPLTGGNSNLCLLTCLGSLSINKTPRICNHLVRSQSSRYGQNILLR